MKGSETHIEPPRAKSLVCVSHIRQPSFYRDVWPLLGHISSLWNVSFSLCPLAHPPSPCVQWAAKVVLLLMPQPVGESSLWKRAAWLQAFICGLNKQAGFLHITQNPQHQAWKSLHQEESQGGFIWGQEAEWGGEELKFLHAHQDQFTWSGCLSLSHTHKTTWIIPLKSSLIFWTTWCFQWINCLWFKRATMH